MLRGLAFSLMCKPGHAAHLHVQAAHEALAAGPTARAEVLLLVMQGLLACCCIDHCVRSSHNDQQDATRSLRRHAASAGLQYHDETVICWSLLQGCTLHCGPGSQ